MAWTHTQNTDRQGVRILYGCKLQQQRVGACVPLRCGHPISSRLSQHAPGLHLGNRMKPHTAEGPGVSAPIWNRARIRLVVKVKLGVDPAVSRSIEGQKDNMSKGGQKSAAMLLSASRARIVD